jgi:16S rRNA (cytosine1402-N4)-methyltransferase
MLHFPVLLEESVDFLVNKKEGSYIDCTYGRGGHTQKILETISSNSQLTSFDKDSDAIEHANNIQNTNFKIIQDSFSNINKYFSKDSVDGILYDLGTCSTHFDDASRGFSFRHNGPLDMRFDTKKGKPLADWINKATENDIKEVLYKYGDEKHAKLISRNIVEYRNKNTLDSTLQLANLIQDIYPDKKNKIHPATKSFQAFRIHLNDELTELSNSLIHAKSLLKKNGIVVVISFHSLEDNIVKNFFKAEIKNYPKDIPINNEEFKEFECIAKKVRPSAKEIELNNRSRSAIMRVFKKL